MFKTLLVMPLFNLLLVIYSFLPGHDLGIAIVLLTILVRLAIWPVVSKQLHSQRAMQQLAPDIAKIKTSAKGDKQVEGKLLMELYKEKGISPFASLLPVLIQLPLFLALFIVLRDAVDPAKFGSLVYESIRNLSGIKEILAGGGTFHPSLLGLVDLTKPNLVLALLAGGAQFYQTKQLTPKNAPAAPGMAAMTYIFPGLTAVIAMTLPSALAVYWTVSSAVAILQQHLILAKDVEEMEETPAATAPAQPTKAKGGSRKKKKRSK